MHKYHWWFIHESNYCYLKHGKYILTRCMKISFFVKANSLEESEHIASNRIVKMFGTGKPKIVFDEIRCKCVK